MKNKPVKRFDEHSRKTYMRTVMAYMKDLGEVRADFFLSVPKNIMKANPDDPLSSCIRDYHNVPGYLSSIADYENRAIVLNILTDDRKKQLVLVPGKGLGSVKLKNEKIPPKAKISFFSQEAFLDEFKIDAQSVSDEIDRALYVLNIKMQDRHYEVHPDKHPQLTAQGDRFPPILQ